MGSEVQFEAAFPKLAIKSFCVVSFPDTNRWLCNGCSNTFFVARLQSPCRK
jgi:hypothetical protein